MRLHVFASGSTANGYALYNSKEALVIEAGVSVRNLVRLFEGKISKVQGCLLSHEHEDHSEYVTKYVDRGINIYTSKKTADVLNVSTENRSRMIHVKEGKIIKVGGFSVCPFSVQHDAVDPYGFVIHHPETGYILFATDTYYIKYCFKGINQIMIECNYSKDLLMDNFKLGKTHGVVMKRVLRSHMEFNTCLKTITSMPLEKVANIILLHMSSGHSDAELYVRTIEGKTGKRTFAAQKGLDIDFNLNPGYARDL